MSLGGGTWESQNKKLPGTYINFVSSNVPEDFSAERGIVAFPTSMDWGPESEVVTLTKSEFEKKPYNFLLSKSTGADNLYFREIFRNAQTILLYRLNNNKLHATCKYCDAIYSGVRGNDLKIVVSINVDDEDKFDVKTYVKTDGLDELLDFQTVKTIDELKDNDFVVWKENVDLETTTGLELSGGTGSASDIVTAQNYLDSLDAFAAYYFNVLCAPVRNTDLANSIIERTKRMRDNLGIKFQTVMYRQETADYEGIISVQNAIKPVGDEADLSLVFWVSGAIAGCPINVSNTNKIYDGELDIICTETQSQLEDALNDGKFIFHKVGQTIRVLEDINTLTTFTSLKNEDFSRNQTIRIIDQIATDFANLFNTKYNGKIPNNESGRLSLWSDLVSHHRELERIGAIENFTADDITVEPGESKTSVVVNDAVQLISAMEKLYVTVVIS